MTLPFPNGAIPIGMEIAFGADVSADPATWPWVDVSEQVMDQTITTSRGRPDEASDVDPTQSGVVLDNATGSLTPGNANSPYFPNVELGTPDRWWIEHTKTRLLLPPLAGAQAEVASTGALDLVDDLDVRLNIHAKTTDPSGANVALAGRYNPSGGFSWALYLQADRTLRLSWSTTGTLPPDSEAISTVPVVPSSARSFIRATLDVDNGAGGNDARFYIGESMSGPWMQIGPTITGVGSTTIFNAPEALTAGSPDLDNAFMPDADFYAFQLLQGIDGAPIADADFVAQPSGTTSFVDAAGLTWDIVGAAMITNRWYRNIGTLSSLNPRWPYGDLSAQQSGGLGDGQARVDIDISGILRRLGAGASPLDSALRRSIDDEPTLRAYWPMEDEKDSTQFASALSNGAPMPVGGEISYADNDGLVGSKPLPTFSGTTYFNGPVQGPFNDHWQVDWYAYIPKDSFDPGTTWSIRRVTTTGTVLTWEIRVTIGSATPPPFPAIAVVGLGPSGSVVTTASRSPDDFFDRWLHVRFFAVQDGGNVDWTLVWTPVTYPASVDVSLTGSYAGIVGGPTAVGLTPGDGMDGVSNGHIAVLDGADIDTTAGAAMGWTHETAMERIARLCAEQKISLRVIGSSQETARMGPQPVATLLELLDQAKDADGGILYERSDTVGLIYRTRASLYNQPPNLVLNALNEELQNPFEPIKDDQQIRNVVTVTREGGSSATVTDKANIKKVGGVYPDSVTLNLFSDSQALDAAGWRLHEGTVEEMRYPSVSMHLGAAPQIIDDWLTCDSGSRIRVENLPPQRPTAQVEVMLQGYSEPISPDAWDPTVNASPASLWDVTELDEDWVSDDYLLRLETDGSELAALLNPGQTVFTVQITDGPFWVTDPAEFPFDINVGGALMTVTSIAAPVGDTQDFTVTPGVNGVDKLQLAGTPVRLWFQPVLAR